jgi:hypothetical protein
VGRQGGCNGGGDGLRGGERRRRASCGEVNGIRSLAGGEGRRHVNVESGGRVVDELGLGWAMTWMAERPENGTKN